MLGFAALSPTYGAVGRVLTRHHGDDREPRVETRPMSSLALWERLCPRPRRSNNGGSRPSMVGPNACRGTMLGFVAFSPIYSDVGRVLTRHHGDDRERRVETRPTSRWRCGSGSVRDHEDRITAGQDHPWLGRMPRHDVGLRCAQPNLQCGRAGLDPPSRRRSGTTGRDPPYGRTTRARQPGSICPIRPASSASENGLVR